MSITGRLWRGVRPRQEAAAREHADPRRMVTTRVAVPNGWWARLPVHTSLEVPKDRVMDIVRHLRSVEVSAPIRMGDVVVSDVLGTGADVIASRDLLPGR